MIPTGKCDVYDGLRLRTSQRQPDFSRYLENLSLNLSPFRRETLNFPPSRVGKGVRGLGFSWAFSDGVKSQDIMNIVVSYQSHSAMYA